MPHLDSRSVAQHVTVHLADSLPVRVLRELEADLRRLPERRRNLERRKRMEEAIDAGHGSCLLREPASARLVQSSLLHFDGIRYLLFAWVVMPNHVHALFQTLEGWTLPRIVASWKSFTGRRLGAHPRPPLEPPLGAPRWSVALPGGASR